MHYYLQYYTYYTSLDRNKKEEILTHTFTCELYLQCKYLLHYLKPVEYLNQITNSK